MNRIIAFNRQEDITTVLNMEEMCKEMLISEDKLKEYLKIAENLLETKLNFLFQKVIVIYNTNFAITKLPFLPLIIIVSIKNEKNENITKYKLNYGNNSLEILELSEMYIIEYLCGYSLEDFCKNNPVIIWIIKDYIKNFVYKKPFTNNEMMSSSILYFKNKYNILGN